MRNDARPIGENSPASPIGGHESPQGEREPRQERREEVVNRDREPTQPLDDEDEFLDTGRSEPGDSER
jgi:hypothetical protein